MKPRLARPLLAAIVGGALAAGGAVAASPAFAGSSPVRAAIAVEESGEPTASVEPSPSDSVTSEPAPSESSSSAAPEPSESSSSAAPEPSESSVSPSPSVSTSPATPKDTIKPTGTYSLSASSIWTGQFVKLTQTTANFGDPVNANGAPNTPDAALKRTVNWGDGKIDTLKAGTTVVQHTYTRPATFAVTERITDAAGNFFDIRKTVKVSNAATKLVNSKTSVWNGQRYYITVKAVPAGTQYVMIQNGDNCTGEFKWTGKAKAVKMYFWKDCATGKIVTGKRYAKVKYRNANGYSAWFTGGAGVTVKKDSWKPTVTVTKPKNSNKLSSWKYVTGTVKDKGSGVRVVWVSLENFSNGQDYCLNVNKKWQKVNNETWNDTCYSWKATVSANGKWKFKVPAGLKKGYFWPAAAGEDWAGKVTNPFKYIEAKITRS